MRRSVTLLAAAWALFAGACSAGQIPELDTTVAEEQSSTSLAGGTTTSPASTTTTTEPLVVPELLQGLTTQALTIEDGEITYVLTVAVADSVAERRQGLMNVPDLGDLDGMLFVWEEPTTGTFWMEDTPLPLDIAFFDAAGAWVDNFSMALCTTEDCPNYSAQGPYLYAIEIPETGFAALTPNAKLNLNP